MNIDEVRLLYLKGDIPPEKYIGFLELEKWKYEVKTETWESPAYLNSDGTVNKNEEGTAYARSVWTRKAHEIQSEIETVKEQSRAFYSTAKEIPKKHDEAPKGESLPVNEQIEEIAKDSAVLTKWKGGRYKCPKLPEFINAYAEKFSENPPPYLIRDYLVKPDGESFTDRTITERLNTYGIAREKKRAELKKKINEPPRSEARTEGSSE
ncbi:MAG: hypothetical protein LBE17_08575 [Treponema sp.]|jgi:hypothetical protein|nr:hypothetical protein [Treponema sp.]